MVLVDFILVIFKSLQRDILDILLISKINAFCLLFPEEIMLFFSLRLASISFLQNLFSVTDI